MQILKALLQRVEELAIENAGLKTVRTAETTHVVSNGLVEGTNIVFKEGITYVGLSSGSFMWAMYKLWDGSAVRRKDWERGDYINLGGVYGRGGRIKELRTDDARATDWEVL